QARIILTIPALRHLKNLGAQMDWQLAPLAAGLRADERLQLSKIRRRSTAGTRSRLVAHGAGMAFAGLASCRSLPLPFSILGARLARALSLRRGAYSLCGLTHGSRSGLRGLTSMHRIARLRQLLTCRALGGPSSRDIARALARIGRAISPQG